MFDPYHKWLGIPPAEQPPDHYRLLGLARFEADPDVIDAAANRQMAYLQGCATGPHGSLSQRLLNEVAAARLCLLQPARKAAYDAQFAADRPTGPTPPPRSRLPATASPTEATAPADLDETDEAEDPPSPIWTRRHILVVALVVGSVALGLIAAELILARRAAIPPIRADLARIAPDPLRSADPSPPPIPPREVAPPSVQPRVEQPAASKIPDAGGVVSLFDGKTLAGWHGDPRYWWVADGAIVGRCEVATLDGSFLVADRPFGDFELSLRFQLIAGNSGVQVRSAERPERGVRGPQADIVYDDLTWLGRLIGEKMFDARAELRKVIRRDDWNEMKITARGAALKVEINGVTTAEATPANLLASGVIAMQLHGGMATHVRFKDINLREFEVADRAAIIAALTPTSIRSNNPQPDSSREPSRRGIERSSASSSGNLSRESGRLAGHGGGTKCVTFSPDGKFVVTGGNDGLIRIWELSTSRMVRKFSGHTAEVTWVAITRDQRRLASSSLDTTVRLWDFETSENIQTFRGHKKWVGKVLFSHDEKTLVSSSAHSDDPTTRIWDIRSGREMSRIPQSGALAISPAGNRLAIGDFKTIALWDRNLKTQQRRFPGHRSIIQSIVFSPDGKLLASSSGADIDEKGFFAGNDDPIRLWDVATGRERRKLLGHEDWVYAVAFSPDGKQLLSGGGGTIKGHGNWQSGTDHSVRLWNIESGSEILRLHFARTDAGHPASLTMRSKKGRIFSHNGPGTPRR